MPALVLLLIVAFYMVCTGRVQTEFPVLYPDDGVLDTRSAVFDADIYHILNHWDYYPERLYTPDDFADPSPACLQTLGYLTFHFHRNRDHHKKSAGRLTSPLA